MSVDDSGVVALARILAHYGIAADPAQLRHSLGHTGPLDATDMVRLARAQAGARARSVASSFDRLQRTPLPALADGAQGWFVIGRVGEDDALIQPLATAPGTPPVRKVSRSELEAMWSGRLVLVTTREKPEGLNAAARFDARWFLPQIARYRRLIGEVLLITLATNLLGLAAPLFFQNVVDKVLVHETADTLTVLAIGYVGVSIWETVFRWLRTRLYSETAQKIDVELGSRLFRHLLRLPIGFFEVRRVGDIAARVRQLETIREFLTNASLTVLVDPAFAIIFLVVMAAYSTKLFFITLLTLPAYVLVAVFFTRPMQERLRDKFERGAANNALLVESITGITTVKSAAVEPQWQARWERQLAGYAAASQKVTNLGNSGSQAIQLISKLNLAMILYFGAQAVIDHQLTVGGLVAFNMFAQRVSEPVIRMAQMWQEFQQVRIAVDRLGDVLNQPVEPGSNSLVSMPQLSGELRFEGVRFRYGFEGPWTLDGIDLVIPAGSSLGIVGSSGSGKSTLSKLIQRFYLPQGGRLLIDGVDLTQIDPAWLRRQIGVVLQENLLFNRTIRENIALSDPAMAIEQVIAAAKISGAHEFIARLPHGYDTPIEERGANLSGGQRQRIAIARALIANPRILILDEATSALDAESEAQIQSNLGRIAAGRTSVIIAHRLSTVRDCTRIITLEDGKIVESGTHDELIAADGRYAALHRRQSGIDREGGKESPL